MSRPAYRAPPIPSSSSRTRCTSRFATPARGSPRRTCRTSSSRSSRRRMRRAQAWACGSRRASCRRTAARSSCVVGRAAARPSAWHCRLEDPRSMASGSLLVVDDEESVAVTIGAILEMDGYTVSISTNGADAMRRLDETNYDLVLTDLRLDDVDGLTIVSQVARVQPDTVSIILTGYASLESAIKALREGAYDYLIKPCDVDELRAVVARGIERRQLGIQLKDRLADLEAANETIRDLNRDLQRRIDAATAELQQRMEELAHANEEIATLYRNAQAHVEQLEELDRLKSRFLSMASHELKTPLTSISGLSQVLLRRMRRRLEQGPPSEAEWVEEQRGQAGRLELLNSQTARLGRLVDELLDVSRIESGKVEFQLAAVDLAQLITQVAERLQMTTNV